MSSFKKATRQKIKLRAAFDGPSGSGKTVSAIRCAMALAKRIAFIDSESGSASKYVGCDFGEGPVDFDVIELTTFSPPEYTSAIEEAGRLGYDAVIIDSLSHAWEGKDGALELKDRKGGNSFTAWKEITPMHRRMVDAILTSPCHVIATMRSKTEYVMEKDDRGKDVPRKVGTAPIQRAGMEYEFDIYGSMDISHLCTITKSRCPAVDGIIVSKPGRTFMQPIIAWLEHGDQLAPATALAAKISPEQTARVAEILTALGWAVDRIKKDFPKKYQCTELDQLNKEQAAALIGWLESHAKNARSKQPQPEVSTAAAPTPTATESAPAKITAEQLDALKKLKPEAEAAGMLDAEYRSHLEGFGVKTARSLTEDQAGALIWRIRDRLKFLKIAAEAKQEEQLADATKS